MYPLYSNVKCKNGKGNVSHDNIESLVGNPGKVPILQKYNPILIKLMAQPGSGHIVNDRHRTTRRKSRFSSDSQSFEIERSKQ